MQMIGQISMHSPSKLFLPVQAHSDPSCFHLKQKLLDKGRGSAEWPVLSLESVKLLCIH